MSFRISDRTFCPLQMAICSVFFCFLICCDLETRWIFFLENWRAGEIKKILNLFERHYSVKYRLYYAIFFFKIKIFEKSIQFYRCTVTIFLPWNLWNIYIAKQTPKKEGNKNEKRLKKEESVIILRPKIKCGNKKALGKLHSQLEHRHIVIISLLYGDDGSWLADGGLGCWSAGPIILIPWLKTKTASIFAFHYKRFMANCYWFIAQYGHCSTLKLIGPGGKWRECCKIIGTS